VESHKPIAYGEGEGVAAKRRVLVDALTMCLSRSKVCETIAPDTIRSVIESASTELWREGEFRLEYVWKILCQQPGLTAAEVAPPLLVFKAYETELGVNVRVPQALSALPRGEQVRLRDELGITKADFAKAVSAMQAIVAAERQKAEQAEVVARAAESTEKPKPAPVAAPKKPAGKKDRKPLAIALSAVAAIALGVSMYFTFRETARPFSFSETAAILQLSDGKHEGQTLTARISDPRWDKMSKEEREKTAAKLYDALSPKGVKVLDLVDGTGHPKALVSDAGTQRLIMIY
jgi:hypothetical protein